MAAPMEDDSLFTDVGQVQKGLEKFRANNVDVNEIYELLEVHAFRENRVEVVTSQLLGLKNYLDDNIIDISDGSSSDISENHSYPPSPVFYAPQYNEMAIDLTLPDPHNITDSLTNDKGGKQELVNSSSVSNESCVGPCTSSSLPKAVPLDVPRKNISEPNSPTLIARTACAESSTTAMKVEATNAPTCPTFLLDDLLYDVNNNDPNNNTEYETPMEVRNKGETKVHVSEPDEEIEFRDQYEVRCKLLREARLIHQIVPRQNLEQIYSYLEANLDRKNRVQVVMQEFLKMELSSDVCTVPQRESDFLNEKVETKTKSQPTSVSEQKIDDSKKTKLETSSEPQPSTSSTGKFNVTMIVNESNSPYNVEPCSSSDSNMEKYIEKSTTELSVFQKCKLKALSCDTVDGAGSSDMELERVVPDLENTNPDTNFVNKQMSGEVSSSSFSEKENPREQNYKDFNVSSTININEDDKMVENIIGLPKEIINNDSGVFDLSKIEKKRKSDMPDGFSPEKKNKIDRLTTADIAIYEFMNDNQQKYKLSLQEIFPDADVEYLNQKCVELSSELDLNNLITDMLQNGYPQSQAQETAAVELTAEPQPGPSVPVLLEEKIEAQYKTLLAILPNADPTYLRERCEAMAGNEDQIKDFVSDAVEKKNYPTREEYEKRLKAQALQKKYTEQFSIEGFLEIIPDPFKYFNEEKKSDFKILNYAMPYLKNKYKKVRQHDLSFVLKKNNYNLTKTCEELDKFCGTMRKTRRSEYECRIPPEVNIPFLQEVTFIENKETIKRYIKKKKKEKKEAFQLAKSKGELLECACCYHDEVMAEDVATCNDGHIFCKDCVRNFAEIKIGNGETSFPCLSDCGSEFSLLTLQGVLKPSVFSKMLQRKQLEEIKAAGIEDLETCPFCDFATIPPRGDKVFRCLNPDCMKESCRNCKDLNHIPLRCEEVEKSEEVKVRTYIENKMTEALIRTCWKCERKFIKEDGCNKMTCTCGAMICYVCRKPVKDYSHFNGQGGDAHHKCPLYTSNDIVHEKPVREEAEKAKNEMKTLNPNIDLKHDPTKNLPNVKGRAQQAPLLHGPLGIFQPGGVFEQRMDMLRRDIDAHFAVRVMAQQVNIHPFFDMGVRHGHPLPAPIPRVQIEPVRDVNFYDEFFREVRHAHRDGEDVGEMGGIRRRHRARRLLQRVNLNGNLENPNAVPQHVPLPANGELAIQPPQGDPTQVVPPLPPAAP